MSAKPLKALILCGDGINCERETAAAFRMVGFEPVLSHLNDLIAQRYSLEQLSSEFAALALPGGFSFGDDLASGRVLALKVVYGLKWELSKFADRGGLVLGICNGFQALLRAGVFGKGVSISQNAGGEFINTWIKATPVGNRCVWLKGVGTMDLPVRHGEGRLVFTLTNRAETVGKLERQGMFCLKYEVNPNGSESNLAGLCDASGRIFGLMPHPEAAVRMSTHPEWTLHPDRMGASGHGLVVFENAFRAAQESFGL